MSVHGGVAVVGRFLSWFKIDIKAPPVVSKSIESRVLKTVVNPDMLCVPVALYNIAFVLVL